MSLEPKDYEDLRQAVVRLEKTRFIARLTHYAGQPIEKMIETLPDGVSEKLQGVVRATVTRLLGMALKALGHSANSTDPAATKAAEQLLLAQKPYVKTYNYVALNENSALVSGDIVAAMIYSGDALMVQEFDENIQYLLPAEGGNIWVDYLAVVESSRNKDLAWAFINFLNQPEHAAQLAEYVYYATPNTAAEKLLPQEFLEDPVIYPSKEALARSEFHTPLPPRAVKKRNLAFARIRQ